MTSSNPAASSLVSKCQMNRTAVVWPILQVVENQQLAGRRITARHCTGRSLLNEPKGWDGHTDAESITYEQVEARRKTLLSSGSLFGCRFGPRSGARRGYRPRFSSSTVHL